MKLSKVNIGNLSWEPPWLTSSFPTDLLQLLQQAPNIAAATAELASIRKEIEEMKTREDVDDLD